MVDSAIRFIERYGGLIFWDSCEENPSPDFKGYGYHLTKAAIDIEVYKVDINNNIYIWVNYVDYREGRIELGEEDYVIFNGEVFDDDFGFGYGNKRNYEGELIYLLKEFKTINKGVIGKIHRSRIGSQLYITGI